MHYYQFNIGDYKSHTEHLSEMEDLAYRRMLDWYYLHQSPLPLDVQEISRQIRMRTHCDCIEAVLKEFFQQTPQGWFNSRADKEIEAFKKKRKQASEAGKASAKRRLNGRSTDVQPNIKQETLNINQEPVSNTSRKRDELFDRFWQAYPKKTGKDAARKAFHKRKPNDELVQTMVNAIGQQKNTDTWIKGYIPNPATWLNDGRWQDEVDTSLFTTAKPSFLQGAI
jgi:uncharacterized protein YdaU (DUF1376 family)